MIPGEVIYKSTPITINEGLAVKKITAVTKGTRPIQIGSHIHLFEVNEFMSFDRAEVFGYRLDIASGTAVRWEPGEKKEVQLVEITGNRLVLGANGLTNGQINEKTLLQAMERAKVAGFVE